MSPPGKALSSAFRTDSFVLCVISPGFEDENSRAVASAADIVAPLPSITHALIDRAFDAAFGEVPLGLEDCSGFERLDMRMVGGIIRPNRPIAECVAGLRNLLAPDTANQVAVSSSPEKHAPALEGSFGYGLATEWATDLAADYQLWQSGKLDWMEVADRALLLSGPPGTGKSTFPQLVAQSLDVPLIETSVAEWNAHKNLSGTLVQMRSVFASVRESGGILFIDEMDGIGRRDQADDSYRSYWEQIVNQLLTLVSEAISTPGVVLIGATNYPDRIDPALLRSGRLERHIHIALPDASARAGIIQQYAKIELTEVELEELSEVTEGFSGADLQRLVRNALASARRQGQSLSMRAILAEVARPLEHFGIRDRHRMNVYLVGQKLVAELLGTKLGGGPAYPTIDDLRDQLAILMAGRVAEEILLGHASILGEPDLASARQLAEAIELRWGIGTQGIAGDMRSRGSGVIGTGAALERAIRVSTRLLSENLAELERRCSTVQTYAAAPRHAVPRATLH
jgi:DNA polymerase III delta prime subunit